ncbi:dihydrofolate reductase family protein [Flavihumibacter petaseus]|uniref:Bacterial bifunctional deaminase-reductase C-terminal domain-containing protein n=1 Tax=Flavihumibacter petaseus NBRC 106054 TaxID=1220578 RepID=A0A0E9MXP6_9BACT|nr:dihydrofolate reductase family protein [Flavihumibacter petaseus]GAO41885.1 hypothetical protein FPE01S_01_09000 [Flavihumibacter petaseus NBRC 106054]
MGQLNSFQFITLNGFYQDADHTTSWHGHGDPEETEFAGKNAGGGNVLLFGRITFDMMASFWPGEQARTMMPEVAAGMNQSEKIVFSTTLRQTNWENTRIVSGDLIPFVRNFKKESSKDMTLLGSGQLLRQLAGAGLVDSFQLMIDPVVLGRGTTLFGGMEGNVSLELESHRVFRSGRVLLNYRNRNLVQ